MNLAHVTIELFADTETAYSLSATVMGEIADTEWMFPDRRFRVVEYHVRMKGHTRISFPALYERGHT
jgi:hypothetical protein